MTEQCTDHGNICGKVGSMEAKIDAMKNSMDSVLKCIEGHIYEADKTGGIRDRVGLAEAAIRIQQESITTIKQGYWKACIVSAIIGGLLARIAPELIWKLIHSILEGMLK